MRPGPNPKRTRADSGIRRDVLRLESMVSRHVSQPGNREATEWLCERVAAIGWRPLRDAFKYQGRAYENVLVEVPAAESARTGQSTSKSGSRIVLLLAHFDTIAKPPDRAPGADDNASGCAILLNLLEGFRRGDPSPRCRVTVCFTNAEEPGQHGSRHLAKRYKSGGRRIDAVVNLDAVGTWPRPLGKGGALNFVTNEASRGLIKGLQRVLPFPIKKASEDWQDDHAMFWEQGYRAIEFTEPGCTPVMHQAGDTSEKLDFKSLARVATGLRGAFENVTWIDV